MKKKIVHLITGNEGGGAEQMLQKLILFSSQQYIHYVIFLKNQNNYKIKNNYNFNFSKNPIRFIIEFIKLVILIKKIKPNIMMSWLYHCDLLIFIIAKLIKFPLKKILWNVRCSYLDLRDYSFITKLVLSLLIKFSKNIGTIVFNSYEGKRYHKGIGYLNKNMIVIPNGFDLNKFKFSKLKKIILKKKYKIKNEKVIAMIARNDPTKNFEIFTELSNNSNFRNKLNPRFLIAGKNTNSILIPKNKRKLFISLGYKKNIQEFLNLVDVLILISKGEGFPNVIGEAMCMNIPVICNNVGDNKLIIKDSGITISKKPTSYELRENIIKIIKYKKKYSTGRKNIKRRFQIKKIIVQYENLFNSVIGNN